MFKRIFGPLLILLGGFCTNDLVGQQKYEKESRMKPQDVPVAALEFMDSLHVKSKVKWFWEKGVDGNSIEAKYKLATKKYSAEFDTLGNIQDVEITMEWDELPRPLVDAIGVELEALCERYKVTKLQIQYSGSPGSIISRVGGSTLTGNHITKYELVAKCRSAEGVELFEYLFSETGQMLSALKIIFKNSSHLEY